MSHLTDTHMLPVLIEYFPSCSLWDISFSSPFTTPPYLIFLPFRLCLCYTDMPRSLPLQEWMCMECWAVSGKRMKLQIHVDTENRELNSVEHETKWTSTNEKRNLHLKSETIFHSAMNSPMWYTYHGAMESCCWRRTKFRELVRKGIQGDQESC